MAYGYKTMCERSANDTLPVIHKATVKYFFHAIYTNEFSVAEYSCTARRLIYLLLMAKFTKEKKNG